MSESYVFTSTGENEGVAWRPSSLSEQVMTKSSVSLELSSSDDEVRFFEDFCEPGSGPMVQFRQMSEPWTEP
jgi:hypothetical protein